MKLIKRTFRLLAFALALIAGMVSSPPNPAWACSCAPNPPPGQALEDAYAVFAGRVTLIDETSGESLNSDQPVQVIFQVTEVWKGAVEKQLVVYTGAGSASCGYTFTTGQEYLVYARESQGQLATSICSRTQPLAEAAADRKVLGTGTSVVPALPPSDNPGSTNLPCLIVMGILIIGLVSLVMRRVSDKANPKPPPPSLP